MAGVALRGVGKGIRDSVLKGRVDTGLDYGDAARPRLFTKAQSKHATPTHDHQQQADQRQVQIHVT